MIKNVENHIGTVEQLVNSGKGLSFFVIEGSRIKGDKESSEKIPAFAIRYDDVIRAFKNRCGHIAVNLDFKPGHFFTEEGDFLVCSTHGALYEPATGACQGGPCFGIGLEPLSVVEHDGELFLDDSSVMLVQENN